MRVVVDTNVFVSGVFLACAVAADAAYVVSGDRGLLASSPHRTVIVIRPRELVGRLTRRED